MASAGNKGNKRARSGRGGAWRPRKRARAMLPRRLRGIGVHSFKRRSAGVVFTIQGNASNPIIGAQSFNFGQMRMSSEFTNLFDQYRINGVRVDFLLRTDPMANIAPVGAYPRLTIAKDYNDSVAYAADEIYENPNTKIIQFSADKPRASIYLKPAILVNNYLTGATQGYTSKWKQWVATSYNVPHYGIKYQVDNHTSTASYIDVMYTFYFQVKGVK